MRNETTSELVCDIIFKLVRVFALKYPRKIDVFCDDIKLL